MAAGAKSKAHIQLHNDGPPRGTKRINLALQGGGAHGAYTWGVLDALLEDGRLEFEAISGTSAGAMNAVALADGLREDGRNGARAQLARFWRAASLDGGLSDTQRAVFDLYLGFWGAGGKSSPNWFNFASNYLSPYDFNPLDINPLRDAVSKEIDFAAIRKTDDPKLFIAATNVHTGKVRVFRRRELTIDMLMASACLPLLFKAVVIDDTPYWDGGYMGNPVLFPFFTETDSQDIVLVQINPIERREIPETSRDIMERMNEITFNAPLLQEFRAIDFVSRLIDEGRLKGTHHKKIRLHRIEAEAELGKLGASSKYEADFAFFQELHGIGHRAARAFLAAHFDDVGVRATLDVRETLART